MRLGLGIGVTQQQQGAGGSSAPPSTPTLLSGWTFNEASGNSADVLGVNTLTPNGSPLPVGGFCKLNGGRRLIAADSQNMSALDQANLRFANNQSFTLVFWYLPATMPAGFDLVDKTDGTNPEYKVGVDSTGLISFTKYAAAAGGSPSSVVATTFGPMITGAFYFIAIEYDGAYLYLSINGGPRNRVFCTTAVYSGTGTFYVGGLSTLFADGTVDEMYLYSPGLPSNMILSYYNHAAGVTYPFTGVTASTNPPTVILDKFLDGDSYYTFQPQPYVTADGSISFVYLYDTGGTQQPPFTIRQASAADGITFTQGPDLETASSGQLELSCPPYVLPNGDIIRSNHTSSDGVTYNTTQYRSTNGGTSWSAGTVIVNSSNGFSRQNVGYGQIRQVPSNPTRFLMPLYGNNTTDTADFSRSVIYKSDDNAATWQLLGTVGGDGSTKDLNETDIINTGGSDWVAVARNDHGNGYIGFTTSDGATWTAAVDIGFGVQAPWLIYGPDGLLYLFYTSITPQRICYRTSADGGHTWGSETPIVNGTTDGRYCGVVLKGNAFYLYYSPTDGLTDGFRTGKTGFSIRLCILSFDGSPLLLSLSPVSGGMGLSWTAYQKGSIYTVMRGTAPGAENHLVYSGTALSANDTDLTNGTTYYYTVTTSSGAVSSPEESAIAGDPPVVSIMSGLVAAYNMEGAAGADEVDAYTGAFPLTPVNSPGSATGYIGNARTLTSGAADYFHCDTFPTTGNNPFEFNLWVKSTAGSGTIASQAAAPGSGLGSEWRLAIFGSNLAFLVQGIPEIDIPLTVLNQSGNTWTHLSFGYDGTKAFVITNNVEKYTSAGTMAKTNTTVVPFALGFDTYSGGQWPTAAYDTVAVVQGRVMTQAERDFMYNDRKGRSFNNTLQVFQ